MFYLEAIEPNLISRIKEVGENDGVCKIVWLNDLNGVCNIECEGHPCTDILGAYVGEDNRLSISVFSQDDKANLFVGLGDLPEEVQQKITHQINKAYEEEKDRLLDITAKYLEKNGGFYCFPSVYCVNEDGTQCTNETHCDLYYCGEVCDNVLVSLELNEFDEIFIITRVDGNETIDPFQDLGCGEIRKVLDIMEVKY